MSTMSDEGEMSDTKGLGQEPPFVVVDKRPAFRDDAAQASEARYPTVVEQMKARAEQAEQRAREISAAYRRIEQERDAFRERLSRDLERRLDLARAEMMRKVISILDDLDRAIAAARPAADPTSLLAGVTLIRDRLFQVLASEGVEVVETVGRVFDPSLAEAVATEDTSDPQAEGRVLEEVDKGYILRGHLLRAARVRVARLARRKATEPPDPSLPTPPADAAPPE